MSEKDLKQDFRISPEQLHEWYLEATKKLNPESFNEKAQKPFNKLTKEQQFIDCFIADKIAEHIREQLSLAEEHFNKPLQRTPYPLKMSDDDILALLENSLFCNRCWGKMIRTMTHDKFMKRLIRFYNGKYSWGYSNKAAKRLNDALVKLENKKIARLEAEKGEKDWKHEVEKLYKPLIDKQKEEISSLRAGIEKITQSRDMFDQSAKEWQEQCKAHEKYIGRLLDREEKLKKQAMVEGFFKALARIAKEKSVLIDKNIDIENKLIVLKAELKEKEEDVK